MEKSEQGFYNESSEPSTIDVTNQEKNQEEFSHQSRFVDTGFQNQPPSQQPFNTFPTFMPHQPDDSNDSYCGRLFRNRRQFSSVLGGKPKSVFFFSISDKVRKTDS